MSKPIIDVSEYQPNITYSLASRDVEAVIIRVGGTGYGNAHDTYHDDCFEKHYSGFRKAGVPIGVYFYAGAITDAGVDREVELVLKALEGKQIDLPVYYDVEVPKGDHRLLKTKERTRLAKRFCSMIKNAGYTAGLYTFLSYAETSLDMSAFDTEEIWMAQFNSTLDYTGRTDLWQYTSSGTVQGINGRVDLSKVIEHKETSNVEPAKDEEPAKEDTPRAGRVKEAQRWLNGYIGADLDVDGIWGSLTNKACIKALQHYCGAVEDGIFGVETESKCRVAEYGDETDLVFILQCALNRWGYSTVAIDGIFGDKTNTAVLKFQKANALAEDAKAGARTFAKLLR